MWLILWLSLIYLIYLLSWKIKLLKLIDRLTTWVTRIICLWYNRFIAQFVELFTHSVALNRVLLSWPVSHKISADLTRWCWTWILCSCILFKWIFSEHLWCSRVQADNLVCYFLLWLINLYVYCTVILWKCPSENYTWPNIEVFLSRYHGRTYHLQNLQV